MGSIDMLMHLGMELGSFNAPNIESTEDYRLKLLLEEMNDTLKAWDHENYSYKEGKPLGDNQVVSLQGDIDRS